jgi:dihydroorotate dehydrogenase (NAD+) catalytic subunit
VQIGTANFVDPGVHERILADLESWLERQGLDDIRDVVGSLELSGSSDADDRGTEACE